MTPAGMATRSETIRAAKVSPEGALHELQVLHVERPVEALLTGEAGAIGLRRLCGEQEKGRVAAQADHEEDHERHPDDHENRLGQPAKNVAPHYLLGDG